MFEVSATIAKVGIGSTTLAIVEATTVRRVTVERLHRARMLRIHDFLAAWRIERLAATCCWHALKAKAQFRVVWPVRKRVVGPSTGFDTNYHWPIVKHSAPLNEFLEHADFATLLFPKQEKSIQTRTFIGYRTRTRALDFRFPLMIDKHSH